jgi:hypothetical protein
VAAHVITLAYGLKDAIVTAFAGGTPVVATIDVVYKPEFDTGTFTDLRVDIWPFPYRNAGDLTREEYDLEGMIAIVVAERYKEPGEVPTAWIEERLTLVQDRVFKVIQAIPQESIDGFRYVDNRVVTLCDPEILREHKTFWSEVHVTARRITS